MDPNDLLYTNEFISPTVLSQRDMKAQSDNYDGFQKYMSSSNQPTQQFISNNLYESNPINIQQSIAKKWPAALNKNAYPSFDDFTNDMTKETYKKEIVTHISVNSRDRNLSKFISTDNFYIPFPKMFTNIDKLVIRDIVFPNNYSPVNNTNNLIAWQYATKNDLLSYNIDQFIIPQPTIINNIEIQTIFYSELTSTQIIDSTTYTINSVSNSDNSQYLVYQTNVPDGYYDTIDLKAAFETAANRAVHGASYINLKELELTAITPLNNTNINTLFIPSRTKPWKYPYEEPYQTTQLNVNTPHNMTIDISTQTHEVKVVNRMEKLPIIAIQTFDGIDTNYAENDIFYNYSLKENKTESTYIDPSYIYITIPYQKKITSFYFGTSDDSTFINPFPLVLTGLASLLGEEFMVGNIKGELLDYTAFFHLNIYTQNGYIEPDLDSISTYKYWDTIEMINPTTGVVTDRYVRIALKLSSGNVGTYQYNPYGYLIKPTTDCTTVFRESLRTFLEANQIYKFTYHPVNGPSSTATPIAIGRALLFRWIFDIDEDMYVDYEVEADYEKRRSLLSKLLGWSVPNKSYNLVGMANSPIYKFVHSNIQNRVYQETITQNITNTIFPNTTPQKRLNLQLYNGRYYFKSLDYIFIKISPDLTKNAIENSLIQAIDNTHLNLIAIYISPDEITTGIGENETTSANPIFGPLNVYTKSRKEELFAKVLISSLPNHTDPALSLKDETVLFYDKPLENVSGIFVEILTDDLKKVRLSTHYSFTFDVHEIREVVKGTGIDTKRNDVFTTGRKKS